MKDSNINEPKTSDSGQKPPDTQQFNKGLKTAQLGIFKKLADSVSRGSATQQLLIGSASGWATGFLTTRVGKTVAIAVGGGIIVYQLAHNQGLSKMDWEQLQEKAKTLSTRQESGQPVISKMKLFAKRNSAFTAGFVGGFLLGIAFP